MPDRLRVLPICVIRLKRQFAPTVAVEILSQAGYFGGHKQNDVGVFTGFARSVFGGGR